MLASVEHCHSHTDRKVSRAPRHSDSWPWGWNPRRIPQGEPKANCWGLQQEHLCSPAATWYVRSVAARTRVKSEQNGSVERGEGPWNLTGAPAWLCFSATAPNALLGNSAGTAKRAFCLFFVVVFFQGQMVKRKTNLMLPLYYLQNKIKVTLL